MQADLLNALNAHYNELGYVLVDFKGRPTPFEYPAPGRALRLGVDLDIFTKGERMISIRSVIADALPPRRCSRPARQRRPKRRRRRIDDIDDVNDRDTSTAPPPFPSIPAVVISGNIPSAVPIPSNAPPNADAGTVPARTSTGSRGRASSP